MSNPAEIANGADKIEKPDAFENMNSQATENLQGDVDFNLFNKASGSAPDTASNYLPECST